MNAITLAATLAMAITASSAPLADEGRSMSVQDKVPGDSPLVYCDDPKENILSIDRADLDPNEPKAGSNLTVAIHGDFSEDIKNGSRVTFDVSLETFLGPIPYSSKTEDLCELLDGGCPVEQGPSIIKKQFSIPEVASGKIINVRLNARNEDDDEITCVKATVSL